MKQNQNRRSRADRKKEKLHISKPVDTKLAELKKIREHLYKIPLKGTFTKDENKAPVKGINVGINPLPPSKDNVVPKQRKEPLKQT